MVVEFTETGIWTVDKKQALWCIHKPGEVIKQDMQGQLKGDDGWDCDREWKLK